MKVRFINETVKECTAPTEQKLFKTNGGTLESAGWALRFNIAEDITSEEFDELFGSENTESLTFLSDDSEVLFTVKGYTSVISSSIRHSDSRVTSYAEVQLSKEA